MSRDKDVARYAQEMTVRPCETVVYSDDESMQRRLLLKREREESEVYNAPETMAVKRRAVKVAAKTMPAPEKITKFVTVKMYWRNVS